MSAQHFWGSEVERKTAALLESEQVDAIIVTSRVSLRHVGGLNLQYLKVVPEERGFLIFAGAGQARTVMPDWQVDYAHRAGAPNVSAWAWDGSPWQAAARHAKELGVAGGRLGVEMDYLTVAEFNELSQALPEATLVGVDEALLANRRIKTESELVHIREAARIGERVIAGAIANGHAGMTDREFVRLMREITISEGADDLAWWAVRWGDKEQRDQLFDRPIRRGDVVSVEFGVGVDSYYADLQRTFIVEPTDTTIAEQYERLHKVHSTTIDRMKTGRKISEFHDEFTDEMNANGLKMWDWWLGHSLGLEVHEGGKTWLNSDEHSTIDEGMVFAVEPCIDEEVLLAIEDDVEIDSVGAVNLSSQQGDWSTLPILGENRLR